MWNKRIFPYSWFLRAFWFPTHIYSIFFVIICFVTTKSNRFCYIWRVSRLRILTICMFEWRNFQSLAHTSINDKLVMHHLILKKQMGVRWLAWNWRRAAVCPALMGPTYCRWRHFSSEDVVELIVYFMFLTQFICFNSIKIFRILLGIALLSIQLITWFELFPAFLSFSLNKEGWKS